MRVLELFCAVDDFCQAFEPTWHKHCLTHGTKQRHRARNLALSEIMTILILFHQSHYRAFKVFSTEAVCAFGERVPNTRQLQSLGRMHSERTRATPELLELLLRSMHGCHETQELVK